MQVRLGKEDVEKIKGILRKYKKNQIEYNEPHFTEKLDKLKIDRKEIANNILSPDKLVFVGVAKSKNQYCKHVYDLCFKLSKNRFFKIPASIKPESLYFGIPPIYLIGGSYLRTTYWCGMPKGKKASDPSPKGEHATGLFDRWWSRAFDISSPYLR